MLPRSLFAVIVSVVAGLAIARFVEAGAQALLGEAPTTLGADDSYSPRYQLSLLIGWFVAAFSASVIALAIGRRWAPLGIVTSATIFFAAVITLISFPLSWLLWPASLIATGVGGAAAMVLMRAKPVLERPEAEKIFDD